MDRNLFVDFDPYKTGHLRLGFADPGCLPRHWAWRTLPIPLAVFQVRTFVQHMDETDSLTMNPDVLGLEGLEGLSEGDLED